MSNSGIKQVIGFIGLGLMGHGLAKNAQKAGYPVALLVRNEGARERLADLLEAGAMSCATPRDVAAHSDLIVICVTGSPEVENAVSGQDGILEGMRPDTVVVDCSTALPESSRRLAKAVREQGGHFVDAAMTGTPKEAEEGAVNLLVGGNSEVLESISPVLRTFARNIFHCGSVGAGHTIKLLHQYVVLGNAGILAEAFLLARKSAVDVDVLCDVIASGGANSTAFQRLRPYVIEGNDQLFRFSLGNALKDMDYYTRMAEQVCMDSSVGASIRGLYIAANDAGYKSEFVPHLLDALEEKSRSA